MIHVVGMAGWSNWYLQVDGIASICAVLSLYLNFHAL